MTKENSAFKLEKSRGTAYELEKIANCERERLKERKYSPSATSFTCMACCSSIMCSLSAVMYNMAVRGSVNFTGNTFLSCLEEKVENKICINAKNLKTSIKNASKDKRTITGSVHLDTQHHRHNIGHPSDPVQRKA